MALLWVDGFDSYGDAFNTAPQPTNIIAARYAFVANESQIDIESAAPISGNYLSITPSSYQTGIYTANNTTNATIIMGARVSIYDSAAFNTDQDWPLFAILDGSTVCVRVIISNGFLWAANGGGDKFAFVRTHLPNTAWYYYELKAYCHSTNGTIEVRVNGVPVINMTSVNTNTGGSGYFTRGSIGDNTTVRAFQNSFIDDYYICDGSGNTNNDFLGPVVVSTVFPDGDDSVNFATTGNANFATHYEQVNDNDAMWTTDYIQDSTTGNRDIFTLGATIDFETIYGVVGNIVVTGNSSNQNYHQVFSSNGTENESGNYSANTSVNSTSVYVLEKDPDTSNAWTSATVNALKFGIELQ